MRFRRYRRHSRAELEQLFASLHSLQECDSEKLRRAKIEICRRELKAALADGDTAAAREIEALADSFGPVHVRVYRKRKQLRDSITSET